MWCTCVLRCVGASGLRAFQRESLIPLLNLLQGWVGVAEGRLGKEDRLLEKCDASLVYREMLVSSIRAPHAQMVVLMDPTRILR